ncbi:MAG: sulfatase-like hydrolase/transferase [Planctomycetota bacterium]
MSQNVAKRSLENSFARIALGTLCLFVGSIVGCGPNPVAQGKPAPPAGQAAKPAGIPVAGQGQPAAEPADQNAPAGNRPELKTPLVRGLSELLNTNPALEDDTKDPLRDQLQQADDILSVQKSQNRAALRQINRQQRSRRGSSPHIVLIVTDNLGLSELNCYGDSEIKTPYIDQLAKLGTRMTQFYAGSPDPVAAHWCLAAGRRPDEAKTWSNGSPVLQSEDITIAEVMWQAGYNTALFGDWGVAGLQGQATPTDQGFDEWLGAFGPIGQPQPFPASLTQNGKSLKLTKNADGKQGQLAQDFYVTEAADFMSRHYRQRPLFLQIYLAVEGATGTAGEPNEYASKPWPDNIKARAAAITRMDQDVGKLLKKLEELKQLSNTVFILTSATVGPVPTEVPNASASHKTLRGGPGELYDGGLRVPFIISGTRRIPAGQASAVVSAAWDLAPTLYELVAAQKRPVRKAGQSLLPLIRSSSKLPIRFLFWEAKHGAPEIAARWQNWKVVRHAGQPTFELYDLTVDPSETQDIAAQHPDVLAEIQKRITPPTK